MNKGWNADIPLGLGMALARDLEAMQSFAAMTPAQQQAVIERTHSIQSKTEMQQFVHSLAQPSGRATDETRGAGQNK